MIAFCSTQNRDKDGRMTESVIVGQSVNIGEPEVWKGEYYPMSFPNIKNP